MLWKPETIATIIIYIDRHRCPVCHQPLPSDRLVYCSRQCYLEAHRYKNQPEEKKRQHNEGVKRWLEEHPEKAKQIEQRKQARFQAKKSRQRYQTARYVIWKKCSIPLDTVVRIVSYNRARGRMKVEWGEQIVEIPFCCVKRIAKEARST